MGRNPYCTICPLVFWAAAVPQGMRSNWLAEEYLIPTTYTNLDSLLLSVCGKTVWSSYPHFYVCKTAYECTLHYLHDIILWFYPVDLMGHFSGAFLLVRNPRTELLCVVTPTYINFVLFKTCILLRVLTVHMLYKAGTHSYNIVKDCDHPVLTCKRWPVWI